MNVHHVYLLISCKKLAIQPHFAPLNATQVQYKTKFQDNVLNVIIPAKLA